MNTTAVYLSLATETCKTSARTYRFSGAFGSERPEIVPISPREAIALYKELDCRQLALEEGLPPVCLIAGNHLCLNLNSAAFFLRRRGRVEPTIIGQTLNAARQRVSNEMR
ncbi:MAG: hypothetical protein ACXV45_06015 [Halobacteriota archaeon]